jgi:hypothetical protein
VAGVIVCVVCPTVHVVVAGLAVNLAGTRPLAGRDVPLAAADVVVSAAPSNNVPAIRPNDHIVYAVVADGGGGVVVVIVGADDRGYRRMRWIADPDRRRGPFSSGRWFRAPDRGVWSLSAYFFVLNADLLFWRRLPVWGWGPISTMNSHVRRLRTCPLMVAPLVVQNVAA